MPITIPQEYYEGVTEQEKSFYEAAVQEFGTSTDTKEALARIMTKLTRTGFSGNISQEDLVRHVAAPQRLFKVLLNSVPESEKVETLTQLKKVHDDAVTDDPNKLHFLGRN